MTKTRGTLLLAALGIVAAACSPGGDATPSTATSQQAAQSDQGGDAAPAAVPGADIPSSVRDGFPVAIPGGWDKDILADLGLTETTGAQLLYPREDFDRIVAFYDQWTADQSGDYLKTEGPEIVVFTSMESPSITISVSQDIEERGTLYTQLLVAVPEG